jgi:putative inorganic carbon (HCO3(-)) transporter
MLITPFFKDYFYFSKIFFVMIISSVIGIYWFLNRDCENLEIHITEKILSVYLGLVLISTFLSINIERSIWGIKRREEGIFVIILYIFLFILSRRKYVFSKKHINYLMASSCIVTLYGIFQYFGLDPIPRDSIRMNWQSRAFSTMGNPNFLGAYLTLILPIASYIYIQSKENYKILFPSIIYLGLLTTMTRGSWLGSFVAICFLSYFLIKDKENHKNLLKLFFVFAVITVLMNIQSGGRVIGRFLTIGNEAQNVFTQGEAYERGGASRIFIWKRVLVLIKERPLFGYGIETLDIAFIQRFLGDILSYFGGLRLIDKAHNEFLHIAVSSGIPALMAYLYFIGYIIKKVFSNINENKIILPLLSSVIAYLVQSFFNISVVSVVYIFWIFLGILVKYSLDSKNVYN